MNKKIKNNMRNTLKDGTSKMNLIEKMKKENCKQDKPMINVIIKRNIYKEMLR